MRFLHWPFEKFERTKNLDNCEILILERQADNRYALITPVEETPMAAHDEWDEYARCKDHHNPSSASSPPEPLSPASRHRKLISNLV